MTLKHRINFLLLLAAGAMLGSACDGGTDTRGDGYNTAANDPVVVVDRDNPAPVPSTTNITNTTSTTVIDNDRVGVTPGDTTGGAGYGGGSTSGAMGGSGAGGTGTDGTGTGGTGSGTTGGAGGTGGTGAGGTGTM